MSDVLDRLVDLLALEPIEHNLFRGQSQDLGWGTVFGGQVVGQALSAAAQTVVPDREPHSVHGYFLRPGAVDRPIVYEVDRIRDGTSFTTRRVVAIQNGRAIFSMSASFQIREPGFDHQSEMPDIPGPEGVWSEEETIRRFADQIPASHRDRWLAREWPIELRPVDPMNPLDPQAREPLRAVWLRAAGELPDDVALHRYLLAYASDFSLIATAMYPHAVSWLTPRMQVASIDHAMWFHRPFRCDEWLLHIMESPSASGARGLARGQIFTQDGRLVASTAQEGLIRKR